MFKELLFFTSIVFLFLRWWQRRRKIQCCDTFRNDIRSLPIIGHTYLLFGGNAEKRMRAVQIFGREALKQGGMTAGCSWILDYYYIVVADPVVAETVLKKFLEKDDIVKLLKNVPGLGLVTSPVPIWRPLRKVLRPIFQLKNLNKFVEIFRKNSEVMVEELQEADWGQFSIEDHISGCSLDSVCESILGTELGSQKNQQHPLRKALNTCFEIAADRMVSPWLYSQTLFDITTKSKIMQENTEKIIDFIGPFISEKLQQNEGRTSADLTDSQSKKSKTILQLMIENSGTEVPATTDYLLDESMAVIVGATKPAPIAFSFIMVMLASHPDVQEKVYNEISQVLGDMTRPIEPEDLPQLKYTEAVIKETIRLYPPVPIIARKIDKDLELPNGKTLVKGVGVLINIWAVHRNPEYWGADAEQFRPERFLTPITHPAAFLGFSYGVRNCIGFQYAIMALKTSITSILRQFRVTSRYEQTDRQKPLRVGIDIMMRDVDNFKIQFEYR